MNDLGTHLALFLLVAVVIVVLGAFYAEAEDGRVLRGLPKRFVMFVFGCSVVAIVMLICEHTFAALD